MNECSYNLMQSLVEKYCNNSSKVLDVGSYDVLQARQQKGLGCYRPLFREGTYTGLDIAPGPNVDKVMADQYQWDVESETYDLVISGQCLEHVEAFWMTMKEIERVCKKGGWAIVVVPWKWRIHPYPIDCWRLLPDGLKFLFTKWCNFDLKECDLACETGPLEGLCYAVGQRKN
jgi:SAM-dependent methyltransferase